jgi:hypothetical protein
MEIVKLYALRDRFNSQKVPSLMNDRGGAIALHFTAISLVDRGLHEEKSDITIRAIAVLEPWCDRYFSRITNSVGDRIKIC